MMILKKIKNLKNAQIQTNKKTIILKINIEQLRNRDFLEKIILYKIS